MYNLFTFCCAGNFVLLKEDLMPHFWIADLEQWTALQKIFERTIIHCWEIFIEWYCQVYVQ